MNTASQNLMHAHEERLRLGRKYKSRMIMISSDLRFSDCGDFIGEIASFLSHFVAEFLKIL